MAKARRRPVKNPSIPRLEWVAKNYPDAVWLLTVLGFMEAAAMDDSRSIMEMEGDSVVMSQVASSVPSLTYSGFLSDGVAYQIGEYGTENTEYDRYIPWLAKSLNRVTKKPVKKIKKIFSEYYPGLLLDRALPHVVKRMAEDEELLSKVEITAHRKESDPTPILVDAFTITHAVFDSGFNDAWYYLNEPAYTEVEDLKWAMEGEVSELTSSFGTVVRWAEGARVNLDDYEPLEAVQLAKEWGARQPKDPNIVAGDVVYEFDDGWEFQELTTRPQFMCEGKYLDHCVKGYKPSKIGVVYRIFSLRDPQGRPVVTMRWDIDGEYVSQYYGMSNELPEQGAVERAVEFRRNYIDENLLSPENKLRQMGHGYEVPRGAESLAESFAWEVWKQTGQKHSKTDSLVNQAKAHRLSPNAPTANPRKRNPAGRKVVSSRMAKTPEWKLHLNRSKKLWETYDAKPLKKHLLAFGKHIEKMEASTSAKVKTEARNATRAFNAELKAHGWSKPVANPKHKAAKKKVAKRRPKGRATKKAVRDVLAKSAVPWDWEASDRIIASKGRRSVLLRKWGEDSWSKGWVVTVVEKGVVIDDGDGIGYDIMTAIKEGEKAFKKKAARVNPKKRLRGLEAIEYAERQGRLLSKHTDPIEKARTRVSVGDARSIAQEDPSLIYIDVTVSSRKNPKKKGRKKNSSTGTLTAKQRRDINASLRDGGFDGNGRWGTIGAALNQAWGILHEHGIEQGQGMDADLFRGDNGHVDLRMAFRNKADIFSPREIDNSQLAWEWHWLTPNLLEVVAYAG